MIIKFKIFEQSDEWKIEHEDEVSSNETNVDFEVVTKRKEFIDSVVSRYTEMGVKIYRVFRYLKIIQGNTEKNTMDDLYIDGVEEVKQWNEPHIPIEDLDFDELNYGDPNRVVKS